MLDQYQANPEQLSLELPMSYLPPETQGLYVINCVAHVSLVFAKLKQHTRRLDGVHRGQKTWGSIYPRYTGLCSNTPLTHVLTRPLAYSLFTRTLTTCRPCMTILSMTYCKLLIAGVCPWSRMNKYCDNKRCCNSNKAMGSLQPCSRARPHSS